LSLLELLVVFSPSAEALSELLVALDRLEMVADVRGSFERFISSILLVALVLPLGG
jgi:hypothetical protein